MYKKGYKLLSILHLILGVVSICLYLPYTFSIFNVKNLDWFNFAEKVLKNKHNDIFVYFGLFLLVWFLVLNIITLFSNINLSKIIFKISVIISLLLPITYVIALKYDFVLELWIKYLSSNIKIVSYVLICVVCGLFVLGMVCNFVGHKRANLHHITQSLAMCLLLGLLISVEGWCGWQINIVKAFGILMSVFAIYLPISSLVLLICPKK